MKIQELRLIGCVRLLKGGSTKPILIRAYDENNDIKLYVLKTFSDRHVTSNFSVAKEILACELANIFDLPVPEYGLINFNHSLLDEFLSKDEIDTIDLGYKFCSEYLPIGPIYSSLTKYSYLKQYDIENIFAFDNLIMNIDRGGHRNKPNLLVGDQDFLMIDHELIFHFFDENCENKNFNYENVFESFKTYNNHIFYPHLNKLSANKKKLLFDEFIELLRYTNFNSLNNVFNELDKFNVNYSGKRHIFAYLNWAKTNFNLFREILLSRIQ